MNGCREAWLPKYCPGTHHTEVLLMLYEGGCRTYSALTAVIVVNTNL